MFSLSLVHFSYLCVNEETGLRKFSPDGSAMPRIQLSA